MADALTLELVTPEKVALTEEADSVVLPAFEGEMGVLPGHEPFVVQINPGEVRVERGGEKKSIAVSGGFAEILNNKISIFAETAEMAEEIDEERARQALEQAKERRKQKSADSMTLAQAEAALKRAQIRLKVSGFKGRVEKSTPRR